MRFARLSAAATIAAALLLAPSVRAQPASPAPTGNTLKIGIIGPFTGPSADFGIPMLNGIQQAVDEINAVGGYLGRKLEIVRKDDRANPDLGLQLSKELVAEKVIATVGFCNTGVAAKSLAVYQTAQLPLIIPCATGSPLTTKYPAPESYIFRTSAKDAIQAPFVVATYDQPFSKQDKETTTQNMLVMGLVKNGAVTFAYPEDAKRNLFVQRKQ
ncbi:MAG: ABC transporter substrate-binding protein [Polaromonas sp.]|nr:ABC transporter substrate-binding protein [Polaromonas sp.]